ncbi:MAG: hypothetical protein C0629_17415 [Chromatiales bacterium]|nr:MAG: hypothetical protein C0629_17415 [Chromatiales bacterium]
MPFFCFLRLSFFLRFFLSLRLSFFLRFSLRLSFLFRIFLSLRLSFFPPPFFLPMLRSSRLPSCFCFPLPSSLPAPLPLVTADFSAGSIALPRWLSAAEAAVAAALASLSAVTPMLRGRFF